MTDKPPLTDEQTFEDDSSNFFRIGSAELTKLVDLAASGAIQHRDFTVLFAFISLTDWRSGRCRATCAAIADMLGKKTNHIVLSLKRLKEKELILPFIDHRTRDKYHIVNPNLLVCGSGRKRGFLVKCFDEALQLHRENRKEKKPDNCVDLDSRRKLKNKVAIHGS